MAFWQRKHIKGRTYLCVYTRRGGRQVLVKPRSLYSHLDGAEDHNVDAWVEQWSAQHEGVKVTPAHILFYDDALNQYLRDWTQFLAHNRHLSIVTIKKYESLLRRYAFPFFLQQELKNPNQWPGVSIKLHAYLQEHKCSQILVAEINNALKGFFSWLQDEGIVVFAGTLRLRNTKRVSKHTPLSHPLAPAEVLLFARSQLDWRIQFLALMGYFFSLRPQEAFALTPSDFQLAADLSMNDRTQVEVMRRAGLDGHLVVHVSKQRSATGVVAPPKAHSFGYVVCFDTIAGEMIAGIVDDLPDGPILNRDNRFIYRLWARATRGTSLENIDLKDLRRASVLWLGHNSKLEPLQLMKHARHKQFSTTELYIRKPKQEAPKVRKKLKAGA
jgi:integrase